MKTQLIRPPLDKWYTTGQITEFVSVPIGLSIISKNLRTNVDISVYDGANQSLEEVLTNLDGDFIGVSDMYSTHQNSLAILKRAKEEGKTTVMGGPNVNHIAGRILRNNPFVDYVIVGDGEEALPLLVKGEELEKIPNLVYRREGVVVTNPFGYAPLTTLFDLEDISNINIDPTTIMPLSSIRGCIKAEKQGRCSFCSMTNKLKLMDPQLVWEQIRILHESYGLESFQETGDAFIVGNYPRQLLESRPKDLEKITFGRVYASPDQVTPETSDILEDLNVTCVYLGIESLVDGILQDAGKSYRRKDIAPAVQVLEEKGIELHVPFMYGLTGETANSMEETFRYAQSLIRRHPSIKVCSSLAIPLPGSTLFREISQNEGARKEYNGDIERDDIFDYQSLVRLQLKYFTSVNYTKTFSYVQKTKALVQDKSNVTSFDVNKE